MRLHCDGSQDRERTDPLLQEAGDSLMMKIGEVSGRLARAGVAPPVGMTWADAIANRNWVIHLEHLEPFRNLLGQVAGADLSGGRKVPGERTRHLSEFGRFGHNFGEK